MTTRKVIGRIGMFVALLPVMPFYFAAQIGERARDWKWLQACVDTADRCDRWALSSALREGEK